MDKLAKEEPRQTTWRGDYRPSRASMPEHDHACSGSNISRHIECLDETKDWAGSH